MADYLLGVDALAFPLPNGSVEFDGMPFLLQKRIGLLDVSRKTRYGINSARIYR